jgi:chromate transporter
MAAVAAGLIAATGLKLYPALRNNAIGTRLCIAIVAVCFLAIAVLRWPLAWVLPGLGIPACVFAWWRLKR